jgi:hypothetical protein
VLAPAWLEAMRELWLEGTDDLDVAALEAKHRVPTFFGLRICLTGFDNRTKLSAPRCNSSANETQPNSDDTSKKLSTATGRSTMAISPRLSRTSSLRARPAKSTSMRSVGG